MFSLLPFSPFNFVPRPANENEISHQPPVSRHPPSAAVAPSSFDVRCWMFDVRCFPFCHFPRSILSPGLPMKMKSAINRPLPASRLPRPSRRLHSMFDVGCSMFDVFPFAIFPVQFCPPARQ
jgi:hypothetical protein